MTFPTGIETPLFENSRAVHTSHPPALKCALHSLAKAQIVEAFAPALYRQKSTRIKLCPFGSVASTGPIFRALLVLYVHAHKPAGPLLQFFSMLRWSSIDPPGYLAMNTCAVIGATVLLYDALLNLDIEVEFVWRQRWSLSKVLYLLCRYFFTIILLITFILNLVTNPSEAFCRTWQKISLLLIPSVATVIPDAIILLRLDALCRSNPKIRYLTLFVFASHLIVLGITCGMNIATSTRAIIPRPDFGDFNIGCDLHISNTNEILNIFAWVIPVIAQVYYFVLIISRFLSCAKDVGRDTTRRFGYIFRMRKMIPTLFRLLRDGTIYFVVTIIQYVLIFALSNGLPLSQLWLPGVTLITALNPLLASRLYLGLRARGSAENFGTNARVFVFEEELTFAQTESNQDRDCDPLPREESLP